MPFPFTEICTLLERLEENERRNAVLVREQKAHAEEIISSWFKSHRQRINQLSVSGATALLSTILPNWRSDRVYGAKSKKLNNIISRALNLSNSGRSTLKSHKTPGRGDLGECLARVLQSLGEPALPAVNVEEIDDMLHEWAGLSTFSDPSIPRLPRCSSDIRHQTFGNILKRLPHRDAKWIVRLILKDFAPLRLNEEVILRNFHFLLPDLLHFQRHFASAIGVLKNQLREYPENPDPRSERLHRRLVDNKAGLQPIVGTKVGRPRFTKAWSLHQCLKSVGTGKWVIERKYDGEYCEIHVDLSRSPLPEKCIKIFSKSGKDSTEDRKSILPVLVQSLRLGKSNSGIKHKAILLGELVVWSDLVNHVLPFSEIRKHVTRSGRWLGTDSDSRPQPGEHLAIVFFDILLLDEVIVMNRPVEERRLYLRRAYDKMPGRTIGAEWKQIDFADAESRRRLIHQFAASNVSRCEGLVLKPCGFPYFSIEEPSRGFIKMKKDYIDGLGDECDFAVIGGSYNAQLAATTQMNNVKWTSFHLGCLQNKEDVIDTRAQPVFKYVWTIDCDHCIPAVVLEAANSVATYVSKPGDSGVGAQDFHVQSNVPLKMDHTFYPPLIFEVLGSGFEKPANCSFLMLRHPRVKKMHQDRAWEDCVTFEELQQLGQIARTTPSGAEVSETIKEIERLEQSLQKRLDRQGSLSPKSRRTITPTDSSAVNASELYHPARSSTGRIINGPPTPLRSSAASGLPSSPLERSTALGRSERSRKRCNEENDVQVARIAPKRARTQTNGKRSPLTPDSSPALVEICRNAQPATAQIVARFGRPLGVATSSIKRSLAKQRSQTDSPHEYVASVASCAVSRCAVANAAVFAAACIARTPYIMEDLLRLHEVTITADLSHWDRNSFAHQPLTETVSESQAHAGMCKIVLVERERHSAVRKIITHILQLNNGAFRERINVYDWRVLEQCREHQRGAEELKKHFLGATLYDDTQGRALFVSDCDWVMSASMEWVITSFLAAVIIIMLGEAQNEWSHWDSFSY